MTAGTCNGNGKGKGDGNVNSNCKDKADSSAALRNDNKQQAAE